MHGETLKFFETCFEFPFNTYEYI